MRILLLTSSIVGPACACPEGTSLMIWDKYSLWNDREVATQCLINCHVCQTSLDFSSVGLCLCALI